MVDEKSFTFSNMSCSYKEFMTAYYTKNTVDGMLVVSSKSSDLSNEYEGFTEFFTIKESESLSFASRPLMGCVPRTDKVSPKEYAEAIYAGGGGYSGEDNPQSTVSDESSDVFDDLFNKNISFVSTGNIPRADKSKTNKSHIKTKDLIISSIVENLDITNNSDAMDIIEADIINALTKS